MMYVYPAIFRPDIDGGFCVIFPDIRRGATQGDNMVDAMEMAEDFLCATLYDMEEERATVPEPSNIKTLQTSPDDVVTLVYANTDEYRHYAENDSRKLVVS